MPSVRRRRDLRFFNEVSGLLRSELSFLASCVCVRHSARRAAVPAPPAAHQASESSFAGYIVRALAAAKLKDIFIHLSRVNSSRRARTELLSVTDESPLKIVCLCNARAIAEALHQRAAQTPYRSSDKLFILLLLDAANRIHAPRHPQR